MEALPWSTILFYLIVGFTLLWLGASWLVSGSSRVARGMGVSPLVIGLTIVAWGTSAPEVMVTLTAARKGTAAVGLGNILGSNIANIGLVLGSCALVLPRVLEGRMAMREVGWLFASVGTLWAVAIDLDVTRLDAVILLVVFAVHNVHLWRTSGIEEPGVDANATLRDWIAIVAGAVGIYYGCNFAVDGAVAGAERLAIPPLVIGLTVVAVGTSLPELAAGLRSAFVGESDISLGNVVGSNVFNTLGVLGIVGLVHPLTDESVRDPLGSALEKDFPIVLVFSAAVVLFTWLAPGRGGRLKGAVLLAGWAGYTAWLYATS